MPYLPATRLFNGRPTVQTYPFPMVAGGWQLAHRVPWNALQGALNLVLTAAVDTALVNSLLKLSPVASGPFVSAFKTAVSRRLANKPLSVGDVQALEDVERLVCWLPCNIFEGIIGRGDDPGNGIDFLPSDVNADGSLPDTPLGKAQAQREKLTNRLLAATGKFALQDIGACCETLRKSWVALAPPIAGPPAVASLARGTPFDQFQWAPGTGPGALTIPGFRHWTANGQALTLAQCVQLNAKVMTRANSA